jgi:hypothetical protein
MAGTANAGATTGTNGGDGGVKEQAQEKAEEVRGQAAEQMRRAGGQARDRVREQVDQRSTQVGEQVGRHASDLRDVAQQLREEGKDGPAKIADEVADRVDGAGSWMRDSDAERILGDVEDFARSNPWAVAAGGLALGFVASRVLKASSSRRYEHRSSGAAQLPPAGGTTSARPVGTPVGVGVGVGEPATRPAAPVVDDPLRTPTPGGGL